MKNNRPHNRNYREGKEELAEFVDTVREAETSKKMSDKQIAVSGINAVSVGNSEVESESTEETTLTEVSASGTYTSNVEGDSQGPWPHQISEKKAEFESNETTSLVEENRKKQSEASKSVVQSESVEISKNRQVISSSFETSQSYEEVEEYEMEC
ncbi:hypothetical protein NQ317_009645 [Molorchus minor]|uniref:Uncharacterized protein n=1 Tax=Molorchus minor TaxID=1323400 RepID=A0ABQ9JVP6_9CUCU|nr:hypothetical protein NQ317_009645 [Molorchus minor]